MTPEQYEEARRLHAAGLKLVELHPNSKRPVGDGWNHNAASSVRADAGGYGLLLAANGLCSVDVDSEGRCVEGLWRCGFDVDAIRDAGVHTSSTRPGSGGRVTFRVPAGSSLRWVKFSSKTAGTILELRATAANLQDSLPGTVYHSADGSGPWVQDYAGFWTLDIAPELPDDLLAWWERLSNDVDYLREQQRLFIGEDAQLAVSAGDGVLAHVSVHRGRFNRENRVEDILERHGYTLGRNGRYAPPTATGAPAVRPIPGRDDLWQSDHASDPLHGTFDAWTAYVELDCGGDFGKAEGAQQGALDTHAVEGFEDVPQADVQRAVAEIRAEKADQKEAKRAALAQATEIAKGITDSVDMRDELVPCLRRLLNTFPELRTESLSLLRTTGKAVGSPLTQADAVHMLVGPRTPTVKAPRPLTEFGNAERMLDKYGTGLMYVPEIDCWYTWTGVYWERTSDVWVEHLAKETVRDLGEEAKDLDSSELGDFFEFCRISQQARMVSNMVKLAKSDPRVLVPAKELDRQSHLLGVENGIVDLRTGKLLPPDPEARITLCAGCKYDPSAKAPVFEQTISDVFFEDQSLVEYVLRTFGYALQGEPTEDIMFIAFGNGANGKSTIFNAVRRAFGGYARSADASSFVSDSKQGGAGGAREDLVRLRGARFVYVNEPDENGELREGVVKSMTGGDAITARGVYAKDSVEIEPTWTVFMPTNHKPIIKGSDNGIWRRMGMLPFERNFETDKVRVKDGKRAEKLLAELPGILNLIVRAGLKYRAEGLRAPSKVLAARESYRAQMDLLAEWLDECCEIGDEHVCEMRNLWLSWETFAKSRGLLNYIRSSTALGRRLDSRFAQRKLTGGVRARMGIRLKAETEFLPG